MKVADVMTPRPRSLAPSAALEEALALLAAERIRHVPVVDGGRVVGVVSDRDLLAATGGADAGARGRTLADVMHSPVATAAPEDTLVTASVEMSVRKLGCLPVVDADGRLVGMLTETDLLRTFLEASRGGKLSGDHDPAIGRLQTSEPRTVEPDVLLETALTIVRTEGFRHLPVVDPGGELLGMLSDRDLCRELGARATLQRPVLDAMTRDVVTIASVEPTTQAVDLVLRHRISGLPVLEKGRLCGIVSSNDLVEHCLSTLWEG